MFMMGTICALFGIALAFILFSLLINLVKLKHYKRDFSLATQLKERGDAYQVQLSALRGYLLQHDQVEFDKFNSMSKELEDAKDKLLSNPNVSESMKIQWNQDQLGENILKKSFPSCKRTKVGRGPASSLCRKWYCL